MRFALATFPLLGIIFCLPASAETAQDHFNYSKSDPQCRERKAQNRGCSLCGEFSNK